MNIIVCDDNSIQLKTMSGYIRNYFKDKILNEEVNIQCFENCDVIMEKLDEIQIDIAFLDIEMDGINGIELGKVIRNKFSKAIIVFATGYKDYALTAFSIRALDFLMKPITFEKMLQILDEVLNLYLENKGYKSKNENIKYFSFNRNRKIFKMPFYDIVAFEKNNKKIIIYSQKGKFEFLGSLKLLKNRLDMNEFLHCHQSYIVNKKYINNFFNSEIIIDEFNLKIPVNRNSKKVVKDVLCHSKK